MTIKQMKFLQLFSELVKLPVLEPEQLSRRIKPILALDFGCAVDVWEYMTTLYENDMSRSLVLCEFFGQTLLDTFAAKAEQKTIFAVRDSASIRKFVFQYNPHAHTGLAYRVLCDCVLGSKLAFADEILKCLARNSSIDFGALMRDLIERLIVELLKKSTATGKKVEPSRKLSALLLTYTAKLKAAERAVLEQRLKEIT